MIHPCAIRFIHWLIHCIHSGRSQLLAHSEDRAILANCYFKSDLWRLVGGWWCCRINCQFLHAPQAFCTQAKTLQCNDSQPSGLSLALQPELQSRLTCAKQRFHSEASQNDCPFAILPSLQLNNQNFNSKLEPRTPIRNSKPELKLVSSHNKQCVSLWCINFNVNFSNDL